MEEKRHLLLFLSLNQQVARVKRWTIKNQGARLHHNTWRSATKMASLPLTFKHEVKYKQEWKFGNGCTKMYPELISLTLSRKSFHFRRSYKIVSKRFDYKYEMRISENWWSTRVVCAMKISHCAILLCHQQVSDTHEW